MLKYIYALPDGTIQTMTFEDAYTLGTLMATHHFMGITPLQVMRDGNLVTDSPLTISKEFFVSKLHEVPLDPNWRKLMDD